MREHRADIAVIGGGIIGLAHAYAAASRGLRVVLFERNVRAAGASVRNFGMVWPVGQSAGANHALALRSREIWLQVLEAARLEYLPAGSLHVVYRDDEAAVAREFAELGPRLGYECSWCEPGEVLQRSRAVRPEGLLGGLWSATELTVDPRSIVANLPAFLAEQKGVTLRFGAAVRSVTERSVETAEETWHTGCTIVCSGDDFETLFPTALAQSGLIRCKLQMMRTAPQPEAWALGPSLAAGLTLRFYPTFAQCSTLPALSRRIASEMPEYDGWGIHVLVSQTSAREITLGDSHEYGSPVDIFDKPAIDRLILDYAQTFLKVPVMDIAQRWHGVYAKHPELPYVHLRPAPAVHVITGTGGSGMTLSFGIAERTIRSLGF